MANQASEPDNRAPSESFAHLSRQLHTLLNEVIVKMEGAARTELTVKQQDCLETVKSSVNSSLHSLQMVISDTVQPAGPRVAAWDRSRTLENLGGDEALLHEVIGIFLSGLPGHMAGLSEAITRGEAKTVEEIAHTLRGELGYLALAELSLQARELEDQGRLGTLGNAAGLYGVLAAGLEEVVATLRRVPGFELP